MASGIELLRMPEVYTSQIATISDHGQTLSLVALDRYRLIDIGEIGRKDPLQIACERLGGDVSMAESKQRFELSNLPDICGGTPPSPADRATLQ